jgi:hypothetical protein
MKPGALLQVCGNIAPFGAKHVRWVEADGDAYRVHDFQRLRIGFA